MGLTPRLPLRFSSSAVTRTGEGRLIVVAGVPATGKSTLADELGRRLHIPVFSSDWLMGALTPFGGRKSKSLNDMGDELVTTLAYRQLLHGQSAIIDTPGENLDMRLRWSTMAAAFGVPLHVIVCVCSNEEIHRRRLEGRSRGIPGWHDGGRWDIVRPRRDAFPEWVGDPVLVVDAVEGPIDNLNRAQAWIEDEPDA